MYHDLRGCVFQSPVELFYKLYINIEISQAFILGVVICEFFNILRIAHKNIKNGCFLKGLGRSRPHFWDRDKTETFAIRDQDQGSKTRDLQKWS